MLSIPDMAILGAAALLLFGPEQLPRVARKAGTVMREIQNTSQSFIREMERAADLQDAAAKPEPPPYEAAAYDPIPYNVAEEPGETEAVGNGDTALEAPAHASIGVAAYEPPAPDPEVPLGTSPSVAEKLGDPRPAIDRPSSRTTQPVPQGEHSTHL